MAPRNLVNLERVTKAFGPRPLLADVSLGVAAGERIGVVGRNGGGKTTLLHILAGRLPADTGRVTHAGALRLGLLAQTAAVDPAASIRSEVLGERPEHEWASDARAREVLVELLGGFGSDVLDRPLGTLSGGELRRVQLSGLLLADLDLLLLDEPTNHLDVEAVAWLAAHLAARPDLAVVVVTHDRWFLDEVSDRTWELVAGDVVEYDGGYSSFVLAKAERVRQNAAEDRRRASLVRKELAWLRRGPPARTAKPKFRIDAANALITAEPSPRDEVELLAFAGNRLGKVVFEVRDVSLTLGERVLLRHVTWNIGPGERVGIMGPNGVGKTSLVRLLLGQLRADAGRVVTGATVTSAYLSQHLDEIDPDWRVLEAVEQVARHVDLGRGRSLSASQLCERLGFGTDAQWTPVGDLSGGERRRLQLTRLLMGGPNVLVLDEPTNDFDVETLTALEDLLDSFAGVLLVISHDRYFLERVCTSFVGLLGDAGVRDLPAGLDEYLSRRRAALAQEVAATTVPPKSATRAARASDRAVKKELARLERVLARAHDEEVELHRAMAEVATDHVRVADLHQQLDEVVQRKRSAETEWLMLAENAE
jgi:ATP-binding cassette subfamily F protein uup